MPMLEEKEDLRGVMSSRPSFGVGGGGGGGSDEGDDAVDVDDVVEPKLKLNRIVMCVCVCACVCVCEENGMQEVVVEALSQSTGDQVVLGEESRTRSRSESTARDIRLALEEPPCGES